MIRVPTRPNRSARRQAATAIAAALIAGLPTVTGHRHLRRVEREVRARIFAAQPNLTCSEWAETERYVSAEHNPEEPGPWRNRRVPYLTEIMDSLSNPRVERVVFKKSGRVGGTEVLNNFLGYVIHLRPRSTMVVLPTVDEAKGWSKETLDPMLRDTRCLRGRVRDSDSGRRAKGSTIQVKLFAGGRGLLAIMGSNAAAGLRRRSIANVLCSEVDGFALEAKGGTAKEGDPLALAIRRSQNVRSRKIYLESTPTEKGVSRISREHERSDQREYFVPCPHCGYMQTLKWGNLEWQERDASTVVYQCGDFKHDADGSITRTTGCGRSIEEHHKNVMLERGEWRARFPDRTVRGYFIWAGYSPFVTWQRLVEEWINAQGDRRALKAFVNTVLGEEWEDTEMQLDHQVLAARRTRWAAEVPSPVGLLTCGVDVQGDRLEASVWGWAHEEQAYVIKHEVFVGNPVEADVWNRLDLLLGRGFDHESGAKVRISATCVDSGGHHTDEVYGFCQARRRLNVFSIKGISVAGAQAVGKMSAIANWPGLRHFPLGTDALKDSLFARLAVLSAGPRHVHFPWDLSEDYFQQLASETARIRYINRRPVRRWELRAGHRNEALDCAVYALAALYILGPTARASLGELAERLQRGQGAAPPAQRRGRRVLSKGVE